MVKAGLNCVRMGKYEVNELVVVEIDAIFSVISYVLLANAGTADRR